MTVKKINPILGWWVTPKLPEHDILAEHNFFSKWVTHPIKRRVARAYLQFLQKFTDIKVIGITGSAGKTTTKEMLAAILKREGATVYSEANIDSVYNIPNTILKCTPKTKFLILEMGVEYPGEMDFYLWLAKPDVGVITNIFPTHTEYLKDEEGVLEEKGKLALSLSKDSAVVLNSTDRRLGELSKKVKAKIIWIPKNDDPIIQNESTAGVVADYLKVSIKKIKEGLASYERPIHRLNLIKHKSGAFIFDDTYNSNPKAFLASLRFFLQKAGNNNKVAVIGDMLELGALTEKLHREVGREVAKTDFIEVVGVGKAIADTLEEIKKHNAGTKTNLVENAVEALPLILPHLQKNTYIFIKGSHSIGLDGLVDSLS